MADYIFQRVEKKYLLTEDKYELLKARLKEHMQMDQYGIHTICNIYYDTDQFELIRTSIEKPKYKEKLRLRSYGIPEKNDRVFIEIKKKYKGVVYKRRISTTLEQAELFLEHSKPLEQDGQIENEINYFVSFYRPKPKMYIAYDREAYFGLEDKNLRITFDKNIRSREEDLSLGVGDAGKLLFENGCCLMEIKTSQAFPLWLTAVLSELEIYPTSFSKYGMFYKQSIIKNMQLYKEIDDMEEAI